VTTAIRIAIALIIAYMLWVFFSSQRRRDQDARSEFLAMILERAKGIKSVKSDIRWPHDGDGRDIE
jgi:hypothetical protein